MNRITTLEQICGFALGLDIEAFAKPDLSCGEMVDIMHTIQEGLDNVSQY